MMMMMHDEIYFLLCNIIADLPTFAPRGVSLDMSDEIATKRRQCKHLLNRLFAMVSLSLKSLVTKSHLRGEGPQCLRL